MPADDSRTAEWAGLRFAVTVFPGLSGAAVRPAEGTLDELADVIRAQRASERERLPLLKLARFGDLRSPKGSLRHDENVKGISGVEVDYDGERVPLADAVETVRRAGVLALVHTSPSHRPEAPRWRVLAPTSRELPPAERGRLVARLNGLFGGALAPESFTLSQAYFFGSVAGRPAAEVVVVPGAPIDLREGLDAGAVGKPNGSAGAAGNGSGGRFDEAALIREIISGEAYHVPAMRLIGCWALRGMSLVEAQQRVQAIFDAVPAAQRDARWRQRRADLGRCVLDVYAKEAGKKGRGGTAGAAEGAAGHGLVLVRAADVKQRAVQWLWPGRLPKGKLSAIGGHPGLGKSTLALTIAAIVTKGAAWPDAAGAAEVGNVLILSAEDDAADTIVPRLTAAGADLERCHIVEAVRDGKGGQRGFSLETDLERLEKAAAEMGSVSLVQIDPLSAYLPASIDTHRDASVRGALRPISEMAARTGAAIVVVSHLNKGKSTEALLRFNASLGFVAAPRAALLVTVDADDGTRRLFLPAKNNLAPDVGGLAYRVETAVLGNGIETARIIWDGTVDLTADEALAAAAEASAESSDKREAAAMWLAQELAAGAVPQPQLQSRAARLQHKWRTVRRAADKIGVVRERVGGLAGSGGWVWRRP